jgi:predicted DNA-binding transcriptional regulator YafY
MTYRVLDSREIMPWVLSWGAGAEVLAPKEFRETVRSEALKMAEMTK